MLIKRIASEETETGVIMGCDHTSPFFPCQGKDEPSTNGTPFKPTYRHDYTIKRIIYGYHSPCSQNHDVNCDE